MIVCSHIECKSSQFLGVREATQETGLAESRPASQTKGQERNAQAVETGTVVLVRI